MFLNSILNIFFFFIYQVVVVVNFNFKYFLFSFVCVVGYVYFFAYQLLQELLGGNEIPSHRCHLFCCSFIRFSQSSRRRRRMFYCLPMKTYITSTFPFGWVGFTDFDQIIDNQVRLSAGHSSREEFKWENYSQCNRSKTKNKSVYVYI